MKPPHICVIGAGSVGKSHAQALARGSWALSISIVDPSTEALTEAQRLFETDRQPASTHQLRLLQDIEQLPQGGIDVAIVATTIKEIPLPNTLDQDFKPGLYRQVEVFIKRDRSVLPSIEDQVRNLSAYESIRAPKSQ